MMTKNRVKSATWSRRTLFVTFPDPFSDVVVPGHVSIKLDVHVVLFQEHLQVFIDSAKTILSVLFKFCCNGAFNVLLT
jgi:hypothetical protein